MNFDEHAKSYQADVTDAVAFAGQPPDFYTRVKAQRLVEVLTAHFPDLSKIRVLDLGCGIGLTDQVLTEKIPNLVGVDVSEDSLSEAKDRNPGVEYVHYSGETLPFGDQTFDVVFAICVWHHVPRGQWQSFAGEIHRVTKPGGLSLIFEHNPLNPLTRRVVANCVFDKDAELLAAKETENFLRTAGFGPCATEYLLFFPFASDLLRKVEQACFARIPLGAQYVVTGEKSK